MRKIRKLSFLGILGVVIAVLFLISISFTQAQVNIQAKPENPGKPDKNGEEATWAVQIPVAGNTMLYGDSDTYINNDSDVRIKVEKGYTRLRKGQRAFHYYFCFKLVNPTLRYAGFQDVVLTTEGDPELPYCIFPGGCGSSTPYCMECFLNRHQPYRDNGDNYEYFYLKFQVGQHSFTEGLGYIIEGIEDMPYDTLVKFISNSDWIKIRVQNQEDFLDPSFEYHNVECDERNYDDDDLLNMNIWIEKLNESIYPYYNGITSSDGVWRIHVKNEDLLLQEQYTQRSGKGGNKTVTVVPFEATGNFSFYIDFIKNPTTE